MYRKWKAQNIERNINLVIEESNSDVGFYLIIYPIGSSASTHDYLQDTLEAVMREGFEDFGVPIDSWELCE